MVAAWMLYAIAIAAVLGGAAAVLERALRLVRRPARGAWAVALLSSLAAPLLPPGANDRAATPTPPPAQALAPTGSAAVTSISAGTPPARAVVRVPVTLAALDQPLLALWLLSSTTMAAVLVAAALGLRRVRRRWRPADVDGLPVLVSQDIGPGVIGFARPRVVLPAWGLALLPRDRALMLAHEREHVLAGDSRLSLGATALLVLMPWNPFLWWQVHRLRLATEIDCDARVLRRSRDVAAYGALLLQVAERPARPPLLGTALLEPPSFLERRITAMTTKPVRRGPLHAAALAAGGMLLIALACEAPRPQAPTLPEASAAYTRGCSPDNALAITGAVVQQRARAFLARTYRALPEEWAREPTFLAFVSDHSCTVINHAVASRRPGAAASEDYRTVFRQVEPGEVESVVVLGVGALGPGADSVAVLWVRLSGPPRPRNIAREFADGVVLPHHRAAVQRHYPGLLERASGPGVLDIWFLVNDSDQRVLHTDTAKGIARHDGTTIVEHWPDLTTDQLNGWWVTTFRAIGRPDLRVVWVKFRPAAPASDTGAARGLELGAMRRQVERHHPDIVARPPRRPTAVWFLVRADSDVVASRVGPTTGVYGIEEVRAAFPNVAPDRIAGWGVAPMDSPLARLAGVAIRNVHVVQVQMK